MKGVERFEVYGCPYKQIPKSVTLFYGDYSGILSGVLAPYRHDEIQNKFSEMIDLYKIWRAHFDGLVAARENPTSGANEIAAFRQSERR